MKSILRRIALGLAMSAVSLSAFANGYSLQYSFTISDDYGVDSLYGSTMTGTLDLKNLTSTNGTVYDTTGSWDFTVTALSGTISTYISVGDVFTASPNANYITLANGTPAPLTTESIHIDMTDSSTNYINSASGGVYFAMGNEPFAYLFNRDSSGNNYQAVFNPITAVPEPASMAVLFTGMAGIMGLRRRRRG